MGSGQDLRQFHPQSDPNFHFVRINPYSEEAWNSGVPQRFRLKCQSSHPRDSKPIQRDCSYNEINKLQNFSIISLIALTHDRSKDSPGSGSSQKVSLSSVNFLSRKRCNKGGQFFNFWSKLIQNPRPPRLSKVELQYLTISSVELTSYHNSKTKMNQKLCKLLLRLYLKLTEETKEYSRKWEQLSDTAAPWFAWIFEQLGIY